MSGKFDEPEHWLHLAAEMRAVAVTMNDLFSKRELVLIAQRYENIAARIIRRREEAAIQDKSA